MAAVQLPPAPPGPATLGRGVVVLADDPVPPAWADAPRVAVDEEVLAAPAAVLRTLHEAWAGRRPVTVVLAVDPARLRAPAVLAAEPWTVAPDVEPGLERLQFLVWANTYDARAGAAPVWWWGRKAERLGALPVNDGGSGDVVLPDGRRAWVDGGPRAPLDPAALGAEVVHGESVDLGSLHVAPPPRPPTSDLAPDQLAAVAVPSGASRVLAPAGSGKTRVLTERLRHLLVDRAWEPELVLAVAYNVRAREELEERTAGLGARVQTLNSLGLSVLRDARGRSPRVLSEREVRRELEALVPLGRGKRRANTDPYAPYLEGLTAIRLGLRDPAEVEASHDDVPGLADAFPRYRAALREAGVVDFDEQVYGAVEALLDDAGLRTRLASRTRHLLVDEFQDLTPAHVLLLRLLALPGLEVFGVGDDDQVIYGYNGADPGFLLEYERLFPGAASSPLEVNYRCPAAVVEGARTLLTYNRRRVEKVIRPGPRADREPEALRVDRHPTERSASALVELVTAWLAEPGTAPDGVAVLARVNSLLLAPTVALGQAGVPVAQRVGPEVLERPGVRAALAYLRIGADPDRIATPDLLEVLSRPSRALPVVPRQVGPAAGVVVGAGGAPGGRQRAGGSRRGQGAPVGDRPRGGGRGPTPAAPPATPSPPSGSRSASGGRWACSTPRRAARCPPSSTTWRRWSRWRRSSPIPGVRALAASGPGLALRSRRGHRLDHPPGEGPGVGPGRRRRRLRRPAPPPLGRGRRGGAPDLPRGRDQGTAPGGGAGGRRPAVPVPGRAGRAGGPAGRTTGAHGPAHASPPGLAQGVRRAAAARRRAGGGGAQGLAAGPGPGRRGGRLHRGQQRRPAGGGTRPADDARGAGPGPGHRPDEARALRRRAAGGGGRDLTRPVLQASAERSPHGEARQLSGGLRRPRMRCACPVAAPIGAAPQPVGSTGGGGAGRVVLVVVVVVVGSSGGGCSAGGGCSSAGGVVVGGGSSAGGSGGTSDGSPGVDGSSPGTSEPSGRTAGGSDGVDGTSSALSGAASEEPPSSLPAVPASDGASSAGSPAASDGDGSDGSATGSGRVRRRRRARGHVRPGCGGWSRRLGGRRALGDVHADRTEDVVGDGLGRAGQGPGGRHPGAAGQEAHHAQGAEPPPQGRAVGGVDGLGLERDPRRLGRPSQPGAEDQGGEHPGGEPGAQDDQKGHGPASGATLRAAATGGASAARQRPPARATGAAPRLIRVNAS